MQTTHTTTDDQQPQPVKPVNPDEYNGWPNYETWNVALWITNDQGSYRTALDVIRRAFSDAELAKIIDPDAPVSADVDAADALQELVFDFNPIGDHASTYSDLLTHALGRVNWRYIVDHLRERMNQEDKAAESL